MADSRRSALAGSSARWQAQLDHLRPADGNFEIASQAEDVAAMADALGLGRLVLVGHSFRGGIALSFAGVAGDLRL